MQYGIHMYSCLAVTVAAVAFMQPLNKNSGSFSQIGMGFSIGIETPAHPLMKHEFKKNIFIGEKSAKGSRKVRERLAKGESARIPPWPKMAQNVVLQCCHCKNPSKSFQLKGNL